MKNIIIAGSINMDIVAQVNKNPKTGESVFGNKISYIPGGKGANQARAISRLGRKVKLIARVGNDQFGKTLINSLKKDRIDTRDIKTSANNNSGVAIITVDNNAQNRIIIISASNFDLSSQDINKVDLPKNAIYISQFEIPKDTIEFFFKKAKKTNSKTVLNPSPIDKIPRSLLKLVDYLVVNEHEFAYLTKVKNPQMESPALPKVAQKIAGKNQTVIVTFGLDGSVAIIGPKIIKAPGFKVKATDTTGAGDSFLGAFSVALAEGKQIKESLIFANACAALKVTKLGASSTPLRSEVEQFLRKNNEKI